MLALAINDYITTVKDDARVNDLRPIAETLENLGYDVVRFKYDGDTLVSFMTNCPLHDDKNPSLSITISENGKLLVHCFAGCHQEEVFKAFCRMVGFNGRKVTIDALALGDKEFAETLKALGVRECKKPDEGEVYVEFPVQTPDGQVFYHRRIALDGRQKWKLQAGAPASKLCFGFDAAMKVIKTTGRKLLFVTESPLDAATLMHLGFPAIAFIGKQNIITALEEWLPKIPQDLHIILWVEPDAREMVDGLLTMPIGRNIYALYAEDENEKDAWRIVKSHGFKRAKDKIHEMLENNTIHIPTLITDMKELIRRIEEHIGKYVVLNQHQQLIVALWALHTYFTEHLYVTPYLHITSPEKRSGKTRLLEVLSTLVVNPVLGLMSPAALFRKIDLSNSAMTLLADEVENWITGSEEKNDLLGLLNQGYRRGQTISRVVGKNHDSVKEFPTFCPKALAGLGKFVDTLADRCIVIKLQRRTAQEKIETFTMEQAMKEAAVLRVSAKHIAENPVIVELFKKIRIKPSPYFVDNDRWWEISEPLFKLAVIADLVETFGYNANFAKVNLNDCPYEITRRLHQALLSVLHDNEDAISGKVKVLMAMRLVFENSDEISTEDLFIKWGEVSDEINAPKPQEYHRWVKEYENTSSEQIRKNIIREFGRWLGKYLSGFGVKAKKIGDGSSRRQGFRKSDLEDAWKRYLCVNQPDVPSSCSAWTPEVEINHRSKALPAEVLSDINTPVNVLEILNGTFHEECVTVTVKSPEDYHDDETPKSETHEELPAPEPFVTEEWLIINGGVKSPDEPTKPVKEDGGDMGAPELLATDEWEIIHSGVKRYDETSEPVKEYSGDTPAPEPLSFPEQSVIVSDLSHYESGDDDDDGGWIDGGGSDGGCSGDIAEAGVPEPLANILNFTEDEIKPNAKHYTYADEDGTIYLKTDDGNEEIVHPNDLNEWSPIDEIEEVSFSHEGIKMPEAIVLDIETEMDENDPKRVKRILAVGIRINDEHTVIAEDDEAKTIETAFRMIEEARSTHGEICLVGHNILGFDLPVLIDRAKHLNISIPYDFIYNGNGDDGDKDEWKWWSNPNRKRKKFKVAQTDGTLFGRPLTLYQIKTPAGVHIVDTLALLCRYDYVARKLPSYDLKGAVSFLAEQFPEKFKGHDPERPVLSPKEIVDAFHRRHENTLFRDYLIADLRDTYMLFNFLFPPYWAIRCFTRLPLRKILYNSTAWVWEQILERDYCDETPPPMKGNETQRSAKDDENQRKTKKQRYKGGLVINSVGLFRNCAKVDVASLYPTIMLAYRIRSRKDHRLVMLKWLKSLTKLRLEYKEKAKKGDADAEVKQQAMKILINSAYGFLGAKDCPFNDIDAAERVTTTGRKILTKIIHAIEKEGGIIVEADTDGVIFSHDNPQAVLNAAQSAIPSVFRLELEWSGCIVFVSDKKNYIVMDENGNVVDVKGSKWRGRDKAAYIKKFVPEFLSKIIKEGLQSAKDYAVSVYREIRSGTGWEWVKETRRVGSGDSHKFLKAAGKKEGERVTFAYKKYHAKADKKIPSFSPQEGYDVDYYAKEFLKTLTEVKFALEGIERKSKGGNRRKGGKSNGSGAPACPSPTNPPSPSLTPSSPPLKQTPLTHSSWRAFVIKVNGADAIKVSADTFKPTDPKTLRRRPFTPPQKRYLNALN